MAHGKIHLLVSDSRIIVLRNVDTVDVELGYLLENRIAYAFCGHKVSFMNTS